MPTRGKSTLDLYYTTVKNAYLSYQKPKIGTSDHNSVLLIPSYIQKVKQEKAETRQVRIWSPDAIEKLQGCFDATDWDIFMDENDSIDVWTETITKYIQFCSDQCVEEKTCKIYSNNKPWITKSLKYMINKKKIAHMSGDAIAENDINKQLKREIKKGKSEYKTGMERKLQSANASEACACVCVRVYASLFLHCVLCVYVEYNITMKLECCNQNEIALTGQ